MKIKRLILLMITFFSIGTVIGQVQDGALTNKSSIEYKKPPKKKYRLKDSRKNKFRTKRNFIKLQIPISDKTLELQDDVYDISSDTLNAVLIWLKGERTDENPSIATDLIKKKIRLNKIDGLDRKKLANEGELLIAIFNNDTLTTGDIQKFEELVVNSDSYDQAIWLLNSDNEIIIKRPRQPRESGGDVIGGK